MVTGAGGSIGSELCRQIAGYGPLRLLLVERCEVQIFPIEQELIALEAALRSSPSSPTSSTKSGCGAFSSASDRIRFFMPPPTSMCP